MYAKPNGERFRPRSSRGSTCASRCPRASALLRIDAPYRSMAASISRSFDALAVSRRGDERIRRSHARARDAWISTHVPQVILHLFCYWESFSALPLAPGKIELQPGATINSIPFAATWHDVGQVLRPWYNLAADRELRARASDCTRCITASLIQEIRWPLPPAKWIILIPYSF